MLFDAFVLIVSVVAAAVASITGVGIGSLLTPTLAIATGTKVAVTGLARRMQFHGSVALIAGTLSGLLGGLVGNQGGIRSAALLGFDLPKRTFVATATAVGLMVAIATAGVVAGTLFGGRLLSRIPESRPRPYRRGPLHPAWPRARRCNQQAT